MKIRSFPKSREEPRKRILLIPVILILAGFLLANLHPALRFIGIILAFTGTLTIFLVGMVFADLWASSRRTKDIIKAREEREKEIAEEELDDPFVELIGEGSRNSED
jgi:predicted DNA repair protein MutK